MRTIKFKDLYSSIDATCMHTVSAAVLKMLIQLKPNIAEIYAFQNEYAIYFLNKLKKKTSHQTDFYVADVVTTPSSFKKI